MAAGARAGTPPVANPIGVNDHGAGGSTDCADKRFHVMGRSFVVHALRKGFLLVWFAGAEGCETVRAGRLREPGRSGICPGCGPLVASDQAAGSGGAAAAKPGRSAEPVIRAMNTESCGNRDGPLPSPSFANTPENHSAPNVPRENSVKGRSNL